MAKHVQPDFLENFIFSDQPKNWLVQADNFRYAGLKMIEAYTSLKPKKLPGQTCSSMKEIHNHQHTYKVGLYLLSHSIELLLKGLLSAYRNNIADNQKKPSDYFHYVIEMANVLEQNKCESFNNEDNNTLVMVETYLEWFGRYYQPKPNKIKKVVSEQYTKPDEKGLVTFKYPIVYPKTHLEVIAFLEKFFPKNVIVDFDYMHYSPH